MISRTKIRYDGKTFRYSHRYGGKNFMRCGDLCLLADDQGRVLHPPFNIEDVKKERRNG